MSKKQKKQFVPEDESALGELTIEEIKRLKVDKLTVDIVDVSKEERYKKMFFGYQIDFEDEILQEFLLPDFYKDIDENKITSFNYIPEKLRPGKLIIRGKGYKSFANFMKTEVDFESFNLKKITINYGQLFLKSRDHRYPEENVIKQEFVYLIFDNKSTKRSYKDENGEKREEIINPEGHFRWRRCSEVEFEYYKDRIDRFKTSDEYMKVSEDYMNAMSLLLKADFTKFVKDKNMSFLENCFQDLENFFEIQYLLNELSEEEYQIFKKEISDFRSKKDKELEKFREIVGDENEDLLYEGNLGTMKNIINSQTIFSVFDEEKQEKKAIPGLVLYFLNTQFSENHRNEESIEKLLKAAKNFFDFNGLESVKANDPRLKIEK